MSAAPEIYCPGCPTISALRQARIHLATSTKGLINQAAVCRTLGDRYDLGDTAEDILSDLIDDDLNEIEDPGWFRSKATYLREEITEAMEIDAEEELVPEIDPECWKPLRKLARLLDKFAEALAELPAAEKQALHAAR